MLLPTPLCVIFASNSVNAARCASLILQSIHALSLPQIVTYIARNAFFKRALVLRTQNFCVNF